MGRPKQACCVFSRAQSAVQEVPTVCAGPSGGFAAKRFFAIYRWHWWVIFCSFRGNFNDVPLEALFTLLLGRDFLFCGCVQISAIMIFFSRISAFTISTYIPEYWGGTLFFFMPGQNKYFLVMNKVITYTRGQKGLLKNLARRELVLGTHVLSQNSDLSVFWERFFSFLFAPLLKTASLRYRILPRRCDLKKSVLHRLCRSAVKTGTSSSSFKQYKIMTC